MKQQSDALALRAQDGDQLALAELYDMYVQDIYRFVSFKTRNRTIAEDVTSDIFLTVVDKLHQFHPKKGSFRTWIYTIARRAVIDQYRMHKDTHDLSDAWDISDDTTSIIDVVDTALFSDRIDALLKTLTSDQRDIIIMRLWEDMSYDDIAGVLGKKPAACRMAYSRAIATLQDTVPAVLIALILYSL
jgi:RNA polymerase sigma-70 factor (ECF subfamily)